VPDTETPLRPGEVPLLAAGRPWEQQQGMRFRTARRTVNEADLVSFVNLVGYNEPLFYDASGATEAGYKGRLVPAALTLGCVEGLLAQTNFSLGYAVAFLGMEIEVKGPVYAGDTLEMVVEVLEARKTRSSDRAVVTYRNTVFNQHGDVVMVYGAKRMMRGEQA
jgi:acyl dehydratase